MLIFGKKVKTKSDKNTPQKAPNCTKLHQIAQFKKKFPGEHAPEPPSNAHGHEQHVASRHANSQI